MMDEYKIGDRVIGKQSIGTSWQIKGEKGTVIDFDDMFVTVEFDVDVGGWGDGEHLGHCLCCLPYRLSLAEPYSTTAGCIMQPTTEADE
jgi:hypothetical protein